MMMPIDDLETEAGPGFADRERRLLTLLREQVICRR